jgi:hypothetical protein
MSQDFDVDEFLADKTSAGGAAYLGGWKYKDPYRVDVLHHTKAPIAVGVWRHRGFTVETKDNWTTKEPENKARSQNLVCLEDPKKVLVYQHRRDRVTGYRETPPVTCGQCKFIEWVRNKVIDGELDWLEPVFQLQGTDDQAPTIIRAGHIYNGFSGANDKYEEDELKAMAKAGVDRTKAWSLNHYAKAYYVFRVLDFAHPEKGVQVSVEPALLGDKEKAVIAFEREKYGQDEGNPCKNPYVVRWEKHPTEKEFGKIYSSKAMTEGKLKLHPTESMLRLIQYGDDGPSNAPDITGFTRKFNPVTWAALVRQYALIDVPWDELYGTEAPQYDGTDFEPAKLGPPQNRPTQLLGPKNEILKEIPAANEEVACDKCGKPMLAAASQCPHCGQTYEVEMVEDQKPPPPPPMKTRSQLIAERKAAAASGSPVTGSAHKIVVTPAKAPAKPATSPGTPAKGTPGGGETEVDPSLEADIPFASSAMSLDPMLRRLY